MRDEPGDFFDPGAVVAHRYRVIDYQGDRGFGQVYEADDSAMDCRVALMRLNREFSRPETRDNFFETRSTAAVEDPRIVDLSDYGEDVDGRLFLVMPWVEAASLAQVLAREGTLEWSRVKIIVEQLAGALEAAHQKGVLHGGLEPSRILLDDDDGVHIVDFGLAPALTQSAGRPITLSGPLPGKIEYLSPEQVRGEAVDARSDIYALGVILWELVAGAPPFTGEAVAIADAHLRAPLPELSRKGPPGSSSWAPADLEPLLHLALAKDPGERIASAGEFAALLEAMPDAEPKPMLTRTATQKLPERQRPVSGVIGRSKPKPAASPKPKPKPKPAAKPPVAKPAPRAAPPPQAAPPRIAAPPAQAAPPQAAPPRIAAPPPVSTPPAPPPASAAPPSPASASPPPPASAAPPSPALASPPPAPAITSAPPPQSFAPPPGTPRAVAVDHDADVTPGPIPPPRKRKLGKIELAIIIFLAFDLLVFAAWKLFTSGDSAAEDQVAANTPEPEPAPEAEDPAAPEPEPAALEPTNDDEAASAAAEGLSVEEAIAAELPPEPSTPGPVRPMSRSLSDKDFREAMVEARDKMLAKCLDSRMRRTLKVALKVAPSGKVEYARVVGNLADTSLGQCVTKQVYRIDFPATHEGGSHTYTLRLR